VRTLIGIVMSGVVVLGGWSTTRGQGINRSTTVYTYQYPRANSAPVRVAPSRGYAYKDESLLSINRSYLGYSNLIDTSPRPPAHADPQVYAATRAGGYTGGASPAPRRGRWILRRRAGWR
jgi:hypothetical protein